MTGGAFPAVLRPGPLEIACGLVVERERHAAKLGSEAPRDPRVAFDDAIRPALLRPPCLVSFSGGRDSSAVLAAAAALARREGLALPVPITYRFPAAPATQEDEWQEEVVRHLALPDWVRIAVTDELDSVGPVAQSVLRRHGVLWPFNAHLHVPLLERAAGGTLTTGVGGDELFGPQRWRVAQAVLTGRARPKARHVRTVALAVAPVPVRRAVLARRHEIRWPWLHPPVEARVNRARADWQARMPVRWDAAVGWWWQSRTRRVLAETKAILGADSDTAVVQPFLEPAVLAAAARQFGQRGPRDRTTALRALFGDVLPDRVLARRSKATFNEAFFSDHSRAFAARWSGAGVDRTLVDHEEVAAMWNAVRPDPRSFSLMQAAWLASEGLNDQEERI